MENFDATVIALAQWEKSFRDAAKADNYEVFEKLLISLDLPTDRKFNRIRSSMALKSVPKSRIFPNVKN